MSISMETGDSVSFQLVAQNFINAAFTNAKVLAGSIEYEAARLIDPELANKHYNFYPFFKDSVSNDSPNSYNYAVLQLSNGAIEVIGLPWISEATFTTVGTQTATIVITAYQNKFKSPIIDLLNNLGATYTMNVV